MEKAKARLKGTIQPSRVYRAAEDQWYKIDHGWFGRLYLWWTGRFRMTRDRKETE